MGLSPFKNCDVFSDDSDVKAPNPNPINFNIMSTVELEDTGYLIAIIEYPDCTNFEGIKLLVFNNMTAEKLKSLPEIDPHFSEEANSPIARFKPDSAGHQAAYDFCAMMTGFGK